MSGQRLLALLLSAGLLVLAPVASGAPIAYRQSAFFWGSPFPQGEDVHWIDFNGRDGYLVTSTMPPDESSETSTTTLLGTLDGGHSWRQLEGAPQRVDRVHSLGGGQAVLEACDVFRTDDSGRSFKRIPLLRGSGGCTRGASFPTPDRGFFLSRDGGVAATDDGGKTVTGRRAVPGVTDQTDTARLAFSGTETGVAIRDGVIYRTTDGARSWEQVASARAPLRAVELSGASGLAAGDASTVLSTSDSGASWTIQPMRGTPQQSFTAVRCLNPSECLFLNGRAVYSAVPALVRTADGGRAAALVKGTEKVQALDLGGPADATASGLGGGLEISSDTGSSFAPLVPPVPTYQLAAAPDSTLLSYDGSAALGRSVDGGRTWQQLALPAQKGEFVGAPSFSSHARGVVPVLGPKRRGVPTRMRLLATSDGGRSWRTASRNRASRISAVLALSRGRVLASGELGVSRSTNGGRTFRAVRARPLRRIRVYGFDRAGSAVAALGANGVAVSRDGGRSWRGLMLPRGIEFATVDFASARVGFVTGNGRLYRTRDGGRSWRRLFSLGARQARKVSFSDSKHGFVDVSVPESMGCMDCFDPGTTSIMRTDDGGRTWTPQFLRGEERFDDLIAIGRRRGVVSVADGLVWTKTGGRGERRERVRLSISRRRLARPGRVTLTGSIRPSGRRYLALSRTAGLESDGIRSLRLTARGRLHLTTKVFKTTRFVLHAGSDSRLSGAGSRVITVVVGRR